jgi:FkbH-like protein
MKLTRPQVKMNYLASLTWQETLFAPRLNRFELLKLRADWSCRDVALRVHRNQGVEQVTSALRPFLEFMGFSAKIEIGDYDDSLGFPNVDGDIQLVWLDFGRYFNLSDEALGDWLGQRLSALRQGSTSAIVVANAPGDNERNTIVNRTIEKWAAAPRTHILDLLSIRNKLDADFFDPRREALTATKLSDAACLEAARRFGLGITPQIFDPGPKAIAVDLDNTIYAGVLGEDGVDGVVLTPGHLALQEKLASLASQGVMLVVVSKNESTDVNTLFAKRDDFPLKPKHVSDWRVSWQDKASSIIEAASRLNISTDGFLLVDDNLGELTSVGATLPSTHLIYAGASPEATLAALDLYPGLIKASLTGTDALRVADLRANEEREALAARSSTPREYLESLGVEIDLRKNPEAERGRLAELCRKTNQFNLAIARLDEMQVASYLANPERRAVMVRMRDRLADSGSVASLFLRRHDNALVVDELCVSCRAMGRHLEDIMIVAAIDGVFDDLPASKVHFRYSTGPRNNPARTWLSTFAGVALQPEGGIVELLWDRTRYRELLSTVPVRISWSDA